MALNITYGNDIQLRLLVTRDSAPFPIELATGVQVNIVSIFNRRIPLEFQISDGAVYVTVKALPIGTYGIEVKGLLNKFDWRTYADAAIVVTSATKAGDTSITVASDAYDVTMEVSMYVGTLPLNNGGTYVDGISVLKGYFYVFDGSTYLALVNSPATAPSEASDEWALLARKGHDFSYSDFTPEQISALQKPATDALAEMNTLKTTVETSEATRVENENRRVTSESTRAESEQARAAAEQARVTNEQQRTTDETARVTAENGRVSTETERTSAETTRASAETTRVSNENTRISNEQARVTAEAGRQEALNAKENSANKQNSLTVDGTGTKFPTVDAVNSGLVAKTSVKQTIGTSTTDVMSQKAVTDAIANSMWYGIEWDSAVSSPDGTRIGNPALHRTLPVHNLMKGVLLADDGTENLVLPDQTWIDQTRDGSMGQVMVKIPNYYFKCEQDGTKFSFKISLAKLTGYRTFFDESIPYVYCSAYEAGLDRTNLKLTSIVNSSTQYRGGNNNSSWDGTYRSLLNMPVTNINRTDFRTYARNRNTDNTYWNEYIYTIHVMVAWLFFIEYATLNSQKDYNAQLDVNGYKQGGLGKGVSDIPNWGGYNINNPFIPNGISDSLGNNSGVVNYNVIADDGSSTYYVAPVPRYRGIQNPFGHLWKWSDGINIKEDGTARTAYVTTHTSKFSDNSYDNYENRGTILQNNYSGFINRMLLGTFGDIMPTNADGSSSTYWCDYYSGYSIHGLLAVIIGGNAENMEIVGFVASSTDYNPSDFNSPIGSRLCFVKQA